MKLFGNNSKASGGGLKFNIYWLYALIFMVLIGIYYTGESTSVKEMPWTDFEGWVQKKAVSRIVVHANQGDAEAEITDAYAKQVMGKDYQPVPGAKAVITTTIPSADKFEDRVDEWRKSGVFNGKVEYDRHSTFSNIFWSFGPLLLLVVFWIFMMRRMGGGGGGGIFNVGKSRAKLHNKDKDKDVTFADVAGMEREKKEVSEVVEFLKNPKRYTDLGGTIPKGVLLVGPPGTGKTMLAKAVAGEANVPFFSTSAAEFQGEFMGSGVSRVRELFRNAKEKAPCIIFIDEIDAIGSRSNRNGEREITLNQLLAEMDGYGTNNGVIVMGATNRVELIDSALIRPGRFDRQIYVGFPEKDDRIELYNLYLNRISVDIDKIDVEELARRSSGFSAAEIANVCNDAALQAASQYSEMVTQDHLLNSIEKVRKGLDFETKLANNVTFDDVAGVKKSKSKMLEIVDFLKRPDWVRKFHAACCCRDLPAPARRCWQRLWQMGQMCLSFRSPVPTWQTHIPTQSHACTPSSRRRARNRHAWCLSTRLRLSAQSVAR